MLSRLGFVVVSARRSHAMLARARPIHRLLPTANCKPSGATHRMLSTASKPSGSALAGKEAERVAMENATAAQTSARVNRAKSGTWSHMAWAGVLFLLAIENARRGQEYGTEISILKDKIAGMQVALVSDTKWIEDILKSINVPITDENIAIVTTAMQNRLSSATSVSEMEEVKKDAELAEMMKLASAAFPDQEVVPVAATTQTETPAPTGGMV